MYQPAKSDEIFLKVGTPNIHYIYLKLKNHIGEIVLSKIVWNTLVQLFFCTLVSKIASANILQKEKQTYILEIFSNSSKWP